MCWFFIELHKIKKKWIILKIFLFSVNLNINEL